MYQVGRKQREFEPGPPSNPRLLNFYGHFRRGRQAKQYRITRAHEQALIENARYDANLSPR